MGDREEAKGYKLVALDMDGTLLMSDKSVHPDTIRDIEQAGKRGIQVVYCSGRAVPEILPYVSSLKTIRYGVCMSGALQKKGIFTAGRFRRNVFRGSWRRRERTMEWCIF